MIMTAARQGATRIHAALAAAFLLACAPNMALLAQGLDAEGAIDTIVGSEVTTGEEAAAADEARIVAAIENTAETISEVRRKFALDRVEIIFLLDLGPDLGDNETAVEAKMAEFGPQLEELRAEIQASAIFYHAIDSHSVLLTDVVALEFDDDNGVTIFVAGTEP